LGVCPRIKAVNQMDPDTSRVFSVFELAQSLKRTVEETTFGIWVEGEVGRLQRPASGHLYFTLKDEHKEANLDCVMYKREAFRFGRQLAEGARVQLRGRASFYPPRGRLQWIAEVARPAGQGALLEALLKLKEKLIAEGLTAQERKRPLPSDPRVVGVVTSKTGAAFSDICTVALRRGAVRLLLSPAVVQGDGAADSLIRALDLLERACPDVIILGRGGGSAEDLMAFNDERLVRRIAACAVPVVSAVGHEIDVSLTDLVADARAATPSQAAEMVVPDTLERARALFRLKKHLSWALKAKVSAARVALDLKRRKLGDPRFLLAEGQQDLDELRARLSQTTREHLSARRSRFEKQTRRLSTRHPRAVLANARAELSPLCERLRSSLPHRLEGYSAELRGRAQALSALSPLAVLGRGYALASRADGSAIRDVESLTPGESIEVRVRRGIFSATVQNILSRVENHVAFDQESPAALSGGEEPF
jgi:exodeoxyribonuclease VII large subunit